MPRRKKSKPSRDEIEFRNAQAASIINEHTAEYGDTSLAVQWARLWLAKHNLEKAMDGWHPKVLTLHDWNIAATQMKEEKEQLRRHRAIDRRRNRWAEKEWQLSEKGNVYVREKNWFVLCFWGRAGWTVLISDDRTEEKHYFSHPACSNVEEVMAAAFDDLLLMEARHAVDPRFLQKAAGAV